MKTRFSLVLVFFSLFFPSTLISRDILIEFKPSYFIPQDRTMRDIFSGGITYSAEGSFQVKDNLYGWASAGFFDKSGKSIGGGHSTYVKTIPLGIGMKYFYTIPYCYKQGEDSGPVCPKNLHVYFGAGLIATYFYIKNDYEFVITRHSKWGAGLIAKGGLIVDMTQFLFLDLFIDYSYTYLSFVENDFGRIKRHNVNIGGVYLGVGLGARF